MLNAPTSRLLPGPLDVLTRRVAPPWPARHVDGGPAAGSGHQLLRPALWLLLAAAALQSVLHVVNLVVFDHQIERFNADWDGSVAGWLGTILTWTAASGALLLALLVRAARTPLLVLAGLCAFLSLDDMLVLHEVVARLAPAELYGHAGYTLWPLVYLPMLGVVGWLVLRTARSVAPATGRQLVAGLTCLATAVVLEASAPVLYALGSDRGRPLYESEVMVEEALETVGWGLIALGLAAACVDQLLAAGAARVALLAEDTSGPSDAEGVWWLPGTAVAGAAGRRDAPAVSAVPQRDRRTHERRAVWSARHDR